jgi:hypothetical protein
MIYRKIRMGVKKGQIQNKLNLSSVVTLTGLISNHLEEEMKVVLDTL